MDRPSREQCKLPFAEDNRRGTELLGVHRDRRPFVVDPQLVHVYIAVPVRPIFRESFNTTVLFGERYAACSFSGIAMASGTKVRCRCVTEVFKTLATLSSGLTTSSTS